MCAQWFNRPGSNLATVARETNFPVHEVPGWATRGAGNRGLGSHVGVIVAHHTAGPEPERTRSNYPSLNVVTHGRAGLRGLLSQYGIGFDGTIYVMGAGIAWHAGTGGWRGRSGNSSSIGIEAEDSGDGDWTAEQLDCYPRLVAALCRFLGVDAGWVCGHKEWTSRKIDPAGINMAGFRQQVQHYINHPHLIPRGAGGGPAAPTPEPARRTDDEELIVPAVYPASPGKEITVKHPIPPKGGWLVGTGASAVSLYGGGGRTFIRSIVGVEDWSNNGKADGRRHTLRGAYDLVGRDVLGSGEYHASTYLEITYSSEAPVTVLFETSG